MPINFVTGLPRQGKTLFTFIEIQRRAKEENRPVFYCNIPGVTLPGWTQFDHPDKWLELPNDSIIVVDELQDFWGAASSGAKVPEPILELSKHGKRGIDFYFITQDPTLVHNTPRKLCETHWYVVRAFGSENAIAYKFRGMQTDPSKVVIKAEKYPWRYPKDAFGKRDAAGNWITQPWYKSADVHNIKRRIPLKVWAIPVGIAIAIGAAWFAVSSVLSYGTKMASTAKAAAPGSASGSTEGIARPPGVPSPVGGSVTALTAEQYLKERVPRFPDFPHTAPAYDSVTKPVQAPYPAACVEMGKECRCYSQQATLLQVSGAVCLQIVKHGFFMDWQQPVQTQQAPVAQSHGTQGMHASGVAQPPAMRTVPPPIPAAKPEPVKNTSEWAQGLAARNAQVRSSLQ